MDIALLALSKLLTSMWPLTRTCKWTFYLLNVIKRSNWNLIGDMLYGMSHDTVTKNTRASSCQ